MGKNNKRKTLKDFENEVYSLYNGEYLVVGNYVNAKTKICFKHNKCGMTFEMTPTNFLSGQLCPMCKGKRISERQLISTKEFKEEVFTLVGNEYTVVSEYKGRNKKVLFKHNECQHVFSMTPSKFINSSQRCTNKSCLHKRLSNSMKDSFEEFKGKFDKVSNGDYELLSQYTLSNEKIKIRHKHCGNIFNMTANNFLQGQGCPLCNISKAELKIRNITVKIIILSMFGRKILMDWSD